MKSILLFGATRGVGRRVLDQALAAGHPVTAVVRDRSRLDVDHPDLRIEEGDAADVTVVDRVMSGHDVVISALGAPPASRDRVRERGTRAQVAAMHSYGVRRLISLSTYGVGASASELPWVMRWIIVPFLLRRAFDDHAEQDAVVRDSGLDWTLVKPTNLHDEPATGETAHGFDRIPEGKTMKIARDAVAAFMLQQIVDRTYVNREVAITA